MKRMSLEQIAENIREAFSDFEEKEVENGNKFDTLEVMLSTLDEKAREMAKRFSVDSALTESITSSMLIGIEPDFDHEVEDVFISNGKDREWIRGFDDEDWFAVMVYMRVVNICLGIRELDNGS